MSKSQSVATKENGSKAVTAPLASVFEADADPTKFNESMDKGAFALPFLAVLQGLSPQVQRGTPQYIDGASPGMIFNSVTKELADSIEVTVLRRTHTYCFWTPRDKGGGFKGEEPSTDATDQLFQELWKKRDDKNRCITAEGLEMTDHRNFFCLQHRGPNMRPIPVVISMTKSQLTEARNWNFNITAESVQGNLQSEIWTLSTTMKKKGENQWYVWQAAHKGQHTDRALYGEARNAVKIAESQTSLARQLEPQTEEEAAGAM
jgi:hypothetical protein